MPESNAKKFLIITSDTGGGHTSAATAIADGLKRFSTPDCLVNIVRAVEESHRAVRDVTSGHLERLPRPLVDHASQVRLDEAQLGVL